MPCGCGKNKNKAGNPTTSNRVMVTCPTCTEALRGEDGVMYPVHETVVIVPQYQVDLWIEQGHAIVSA